MLGPRVQRRTAEVIVAEIGTDMSAFPTTKHLAARAGQCPGNDHSASRRRSDRTRKGSKWLDWALEEALVAVRSKDTYLAAQYNRLRPRRGHKKALGAVKHSILSPRLAHARHRGTLQRPRRGVLPAPRSRASDEALGPPSSQGARAQRHA